MYKIHSGHFDTLFCVTLDTRMLVPFSSVWQIVIMTYVSRIPMKKFYEMPSFKGAFEN